MNGRETVREWWAQHTASRLKDPHYSYQDFEAACRTGKASASGQRREDAERTMSLGQLARFRAACERVPYYGEVPHYDGYQVPPMLGIDWGTALPPRSLFLSRISS